MVKFDDTSLYTLVDDVPASGYEGQMVFNKSNSQLEVWYDGAWNPVSFGGGSSGPTTSSLYDTAAYDTTGVYA